MDEDDFEFGEMPEDEDENHEMNREDYDAVNDETFGAAENFAPADDLEDYAAQTACLRLDDSEWAAGGSGNAAPDASQLPMPSFDQLFSSSSTSADPFSFGKFDDIWSTGGVFNLWATPKDKDTDIWATPNDAFSFKFSGGAQQPTKIPSPQPPLPPSVAPSTSSAASSKLPKLPPSASTLEEIEQQMLAATRQRAEQLQQHLQLQQQHLQLQQQASAAAAPPLQTTVQTTAGPLRLGDLGLRLSSSAERPALPPLPSGAAVSAADLERRMLDESARRVVPPPALPVHLPSSSQPLPIGAAQKPQMQAGSLPGQLGQPLHPNMYAPGPVGTPPTRQPPGAPPMMPPLPPLPPIPPQMQQMFAQFMPAWVELITRKQSFPPFVPPVPALAVPYVQRMLYLKRMGLLPPPPGGPGMAPAAMHPAQQQQQWVQQQTHQQQPRYLRKQGMPSGRTIEDYALNPFAGMMSCKEREWLVKVHSLQCAGCGNPYEDDFYYTCWKQRRLVESEEGRKENRRNGLQSECDFTLTATPYHYVPPKFAGSLGKPTLSTSAFPRQLIDVRNKEQSPLGVDDDSVSEVSEARSTAQRRYRTLLLFIESAALVLLEVDDRKRQLSAGATEEAYEVLKKEIAARVEVLRTELCADGMLAKVFTIAKGRALFAHLFAVAPKPAQIQLLHHLFEAMPVYNKRLHDTLSKTFSPPVLEILSKYTRENIVNAVSSVSVDSVSKAFDASNTFCRDLLLAVLVSAAKKRLNTNTAPVLEWLSENGKLPDFPSSPVLSLGELEPVGEYLRSLSSSPSSRAFQLALSLKETSS